MSKKIKIELPNGDIIERTPRARTLGNFSQIYITYKNKEYAVGDGDEYLRGMPATFRLNYLSTGIKPLYITYPEKAEEIKKWRAKYPESTIYDNYIEI